MNELICVKSFLKTNIVLLLYSVYIHILITDNVLHKLLGTCIVVQRFIDMITNMNFTSN